MRFLAKAYGYYPDDIQVCLKHDVLCENFYEKFENAIMFLLYPKEDLEAQKDECFADAAKTIAHCEKVLGDSRWIFGEKLTAADFYYGSYYCSFVTNQLINEPERKKRLIA